MRTSYRKLGDPSVIFLLFPMRLHLDRDRLDFRVLLKSILAHLTTNSGLFEAAEGSCSVENIKTADPSGARGNDEDLRARLQQLTEGYSVERAIDCVAGDLGAEIARNLAPGGTMLVGGALSSH